MTIHPLVPSMRVPSVSRWLLPMASLLLAAGHASGADSTKFKRIEPQFIAALGDPGSSSGNGAQAWGFWDKDPGPRACKLDHYPQLKATGVAPAHWKFLKVSPSTASGQTARSWPRNSTLTRVLTSKKILI